MSHKVRNARVIYDFDCPACGKELTLQNFKILGKTNRHLTTDDCLCCKARLSIDYDKVSNKVVATVKEKAQ